MNFYLFFTALAAAFEMWRGSFSTGIHSMEVLLMLDLLQIIFVLFWLNIYCFLRYVL